MKRAKIRKFVHPEPQFFFFTRVITIDELIGMYPPQDVDKEGLISGEIGVVDCGIRFVGANRD